MRADHNPLPEMRTDYFHDCCSHFMSRFPDADEVDGIDIPQFPKRAGSKPDYSGVRFYSARNQILWIYSV